MKATRREGTEPERALRTALHARGLRYRLHRRIEGVPRVKPDIVFVSARVAVYVDGCFWHSCPIHGTAPKSNSKWWCEKLTKNVERDRRTDEALAAAGWKVVRIWEHEDPEEAANKIQQVIADR